MRSIKKALKISVVALLSSAVAVGVAACGGGHTHHFAETYAYNENTHWHPCDAEEGCTAKRAEDVHSFETINGKYVCIACGYEQGAAIQDGTGGSTGGSTGGNTPTNPGETVIPTTPAGAVKITEAAGDLEAAYAIWDKVDGAMGYNVYCKAESGSYVKLDAPLVREYKDGNKEYFRADAVGLKAGKYTLRVVPTGGAELAEDESKAATAEITVLAHDRSGYAFVNGTSSGAYNDDGTLKSNANVLYITDNNKHTVKMTVAGTECVGLQDILTAYKKETSPLAVRLVGNIDKPDSAMSDSGDFTIKEITAGITFEGIGNDATANKWGLRIIKSSNVEVRNFGFMNAEGGTKDNVGIETENNHIWIHNCDMFYGKDWGGDQKKGDGALDTKDTTYVTHSYNHFWDSGKCNLQGMKSETTSNFITYHHNWYDHSDSRHPRIRTCTVHTYNNYFDGNAKYGVGVTMGASAFVENNYFRSTATMKPMLSSEQGTDAAGDGTFSSEAGGMIKAYGNTFDGKYSLITQNDTADKTDIDCYMATSRDEQVPSDYVTKKGGTTYNNFDTAADFYEYTPDTAEVAKQNVETWAGRIGGGDFKWDFDDATEDANYDVIPALREALTAYTTKLVKVGGEDVSGGTGGSTGEEDVSGETGEETGGSTGGEDVSGGAVSADVGKIEITQANSANYPAGLTVSGNYDSTTGYLKIESSTVVTINAESDITVTVHTSEPSKTMKFDGTSVTLDGNGEYTITVKAGETLTITKGDIMQLQYIIIS